jgi:hypothetical protein
MTSNAGPIGHPAGESMAAGQVPVEAAREIRPTVAQLFDLLVAC